MDQNSVGRSSGHHRKKLKRSERRAQRRAEKQRKEELMAVAAGRSDGGFPGNARKGATGDSGTGAAGDAAGGILAGGNHSGRTRSGGSGGSKRRWYRRPLFLVPLLLVLVLAAGGIMAAVRYNAISFASSGSSKAGAANTPAGRTQTTAAAPLTATERMVASMSLEQKIGQMMMVGFDGTSPSQEVTDAIQKLHAGGIILSGQNIESHDQVAAMDDSLQKLAAGAGQPAKLMIAVAQEGGETRLFNDIGPYYSQPMIGEMHSVAPDAALQQASSAARDLKKLGINTNLAPEADVSSGWGSLMDVRSYGEDPQFNADTVAGAVKGYNNSTTICAPKYFPGIGKADDDPKDSLPIVHSDLKTIQSTGLLPFASAIKQGAPMIMVADVAVPALDASGTPASLSRPIITDLLRGTMGFSGVVITDDLELKAITGNYKVGNAAVAAVAAGADIVVISQNADDQQAAFNGLVEAVKSGKLHEADIDKSVVRILDMKEKYRLERETPSG